MPLSPRASLWGAALAVVALLATAAPALAGGQDSANGTPISLTVTQDSGGQYTFAVSKFNGSAVLVRFWEVTDASRDVDDGGGIQIGSCTPSQPGATLANNTLTCTITPSPSISTGTVQVVAAEYSSPNTGAGNTIENNEVKEESKPVTITGGIPQNNLPEVPYAALLPALAIGAVLLLRRKRTQLG